MNKNLNGLVGLVGIVLLAAILAGVYFLSGGSKSSEAQSLKISFKDNSEESISVSPQEISEAIAPYEYSAYLELADMKIMEHFYEKNKVEVSEVAVEEKFNEYVDESFENDKDFISYCEEYGTSKDAVKRQIRLSLLSEEYQKQLKDTVVLTDEEYTNEWSTNKQNYQRVVANLYMYPDKKSMKDAYKMAVSGQSIKDTTTSFLENQYLSYTDMTLGIDFTSAKEGEFYTSDTTGEFYIVEVVTIYGTFEQCKNDIKDYLSNSKAAQIAADNAGKYYENIEVFVKNKPVKQNGDSETEEATSSAITEGVLNEEIPVDEGADSTSNSGEISDGTTVESSGEDVVSEGGINE